ncbi:MAG: hypothetical protein AAFV88_07820 [Planctomycetota bacterium]
MFYFGNVIGDTGIGNTTSRIRVNAIDTIQVRANQSLAPNSAAVDNPFDINRDGRVNAIDTILVRSNQDLAGSVAPISTPASGFGIFSGSGLSDSKGESKGSDLRDIDDALEGTDDFLKGLTL